MFGHANTGDKLIIIIRKGVKERLDNMQQACHLHSFAKKLQFNNLPRRSMGESTGHNQFRCRPSKFWVTWEDACKSMASVGCGHHKGMESEILNFRTKGVLSLSSPSCCLWDSHALHSPTWLTATQDPPNGLMD